MSEPSDIGAPKDPAGYGSRPLIGLSFWAMVAFSVLCVLAGAAIAHYGPQLFAPKSAPHATEVAPPVEAPSVPAAVVAPPAAPTPAVPPSADLARLNARMAILETRQAHAAQASASALAAAAVAEATQGSGPFADEIASLRASVPDSPEIVALARLAPVGAPSRMALAASFPDFAARAASAGHAPGDRAGLGDRIVYELSRIVSLRRVGETSGEGVDAVLARAERLVADGDLDRAFKDLDRLPPASRDALAPWRARAERRTEIDRNAEALRARALQDLAAETRGGA